MHKNLLPTFFLVLQITVGLPAQSLTSAQVINPSDNAPLTAGAVDAGGNFYAASLANVKTTAAGSGIFGVYPVGDPVISKYAPDGTLLWRLEFPDNHARIFDVAVTPDQGVVIAGAYFDTLRSFAMSSLRGAQFNTNWWMARIYPDGFVGWLRTDVSDLGSDMLPVAVRVRGNRVYTAGLHESVSASLREYNLVSGSLLRERVFESLRTFSDLEFDDAGHLYVVGTAAPDSPVDSLVVPVPAGGDPGYANFVMRLDQNFVAQWIRSTSYITFDFHPRVELFNGQVFTLSHDFGGPGLNDGAMTLRAYTPDGTPGWSQPVDGNAGWNDIFSFALKAACDRLVVARPVVYAFNNVGLELYALDTDLDETVLATTTDGDFNQNNYPFLATGGSRLVLGVNFAADTLAINGAVAVTNPDAADYRQLVLGFDCAGASPVNTPGTVPAEWKIGTNPVGEALQLIAPANLTDPVPAQVIDAQGRVLMSVTAGNAGLRVPVGHLAPGVYYVKISGRLMRWVKG